MKKALVCGLLTAMLLAALVACSQPQADQPSEPALAAAAVQTDATDTPPEPAATQEPTAQTPADPEPAQTTAPPEPEPTEDVEPQVPEETEPSVDPSPNSSEPVSSQSVASESNTAPSPSPSADPSPMPDPSAEPGTDPGAAPSPSASEPPAQSEDIPWYLTLVNPTHFLPEDFSVETAKISNGQSFDSRACNALSQMLAACRSAGLQPLVCSAYRTQQTQERLFQNKVSRLMAQGYSESVAKVEAGKVVAVPGTSEHQLGLAADIVDVNNQNLDESQENTPVQKWLMEHCWEYGFILRYPNDKSEITGIIYEPWHYRYVGVDVAKEIMEQGICLEEYMAEHYGIE